MIQIPPTNGDYWISPRALTFSENDLNDPMRVAVSLVSGTVIKAYKKGIIDYAFDGEPERWTLKGYSTKLIYKEAHFVYARLSRTDRTALIVFSVKDYNIDGSITTVTGKDENGNDITETTEPSADYFYIKIGELTATDGTSSRELTYDSGLLSTKKGDEESSLLHELWELIKGTNPLIRAKYWLTDFVVKGFITLIGGFRFSKGKDGDEKSIVDIKRSVDSDEDVPISDESVPTTKYVNELSDKKYLRKDMNDRSVGQIATDVGFEAGEFNTGATGAACYKDEQGGWHIETDFLKVRRKATFTEIEVQEVYHVGGQMLLTAASMTVDYVLEMEDRYRCYFAKKDESGREVENLWKKGDQAYCNTFNLEKQSDGTVGNHYLWRLVVATNRDTKDDSDNRTFGEVVIRTEDYNFTDLSKLECGVGSDAPKSGDEIVHLGYQGADDPSRQNAVIIAGAGEGSPYIYEFTGIGVTPFELPAPETKLKPGDNLFTGIVNIQPGSTGVENLAGLPEEIFKAAQVGSVNLLLNSGFTGGYQTEELSSGASLNSDSELYSKKMKHWESTGSVLPEEESASGYAAVIGQMEQPVTLIDYENYVVSFKAKGSSLDVWLGNTKQTLALSSSYRIYRLQYSFKHTLIGVHRFKMVGDATVCEVQVERGTIATDWKPSPLDNDKSFAEFMSLQYLSDAMKNGSTSVIGGLILSSMIQLGNYVDGIMKKVNAGMSGIYNDDDDVAFWGGGTFEQAIKTVMKFKENPLYRPTDLEWQSLANFVVTHGGDLILKGNVFADNGYFRGRLEAKEGFFHGDVYANSGIFKNVKSPNGSFTIDEEGNVKIIGTFETSVAGKRIVIDADSQSIVLYDELGRETAKMNFYDDVGESWTYGSVQLRRYQQDSSNVAMESFISASQVDVIDYIKKYESHYRAGFMQATSIDGKNASMTISLHKQYESSQPNSEYSWLSIIQSDCWPTSSENVGVGGIYSDNGTLKIRQQ